jgi:hypothetical protein
LNNADFRQLLVFGIIATLFAAVPGCRSNKFEGKYVGVGNMVTIEFKDGKATITDSTGGAPEIADYTVDGDKITIKAKAGDMQFTKMQDGSIAAPWPIGNLQKAAS